MADETITETTKAETIKEATTKTEATKTGKGNKGQKLIILLLLVIIGIGAGLFYQLMKPKPVYSRLARDEQALGGMLPGKTPEEIADLLSQKVEEGMVNIGISARPIFERNGAKGRIGIENIAANRYSFIVTIRLDETGEVVYESGLIEPDRYIEYVALNRTLAEGSYPATAIFETYSLDESEDRIAEAHMKIELLVTDVVLYGDDGK